MTEEDKAALKKEIISVLNDFFVSEQGNRITRYNFMTLVNEVVSRLDKHMGGSDDRKKD